MKPSKEEHDKAMKKWREQAIEAKKQVELMQAAGRFPKLDPELWTYDYVRHEYIYLGE